MTRIGAALFLALVGCATARDYTVISARLASKMLIARGCPVGPHLMLTAGHVVRPRGAVGFIPPRWSSTDGQTEGISTVQRWNVGTDIAVLRTDTELRSYNAISEARPQLGAKVLIVGYDFKQPSIPTRAVEATITAVFAGHIYYDRSPGAGGSGSCVEDAVTRKVYAIHSGSNDKRAWGVAVWGRWNPVTPGSGGSGSCVIPALLGDEA